MKLAAYYKSKREIVVLSPSFTPERHQKFFLRKDYNDGMFPAGLEKIPNLDYGGYAFTNGVYVPMDRSIEIMHPDTSIYSVMEKTIRNFGEKRESKKIFNNLMEAEHCRISLDGKTIWPEYHKQFKALKMSRNLIFHDYDLGKIKGSIDEIQKILRLARTDGWATRVGMKFPVTIYTGDDLLKWVKIRPNSTFFFLRYDGVIDDDAFEYFVGSCHEKTIYRDLEYYVTATSENEKEFIEKYIQRIFRQVVTSRSYRVFFTLKYEEDFFFEKRWEDVIELMNFYHNSLKNVPQALYYRKITDDTMYDFAKATYDELPFQYKKGMTKEKIREIFRFVAKNHPALFDDFYNFNVRKVLNYD